MRFTIEREILIRMIRQACGPLKTKKAKKLSFQLSIWRSRVRSSKQTKARILPMSPVKLTT